MKTKNEVKTGHTPEPWTDCKVGAQFGPHGGAQYRSRRYFRCGCDAGKCQNHAQSFPLGPVWEEGQPRKCRTCKAKATSQEVR